jgi:acyl-CoA thioesterase FadM
MDFIIVSHKEEAVVAEGSGVVVCVDKDTGKKTDLPDFVRTALIDSCAEDYRRGRDISSKI